MPYIPQNRRGAIVVRDKDGAAQIGVSRITNADELSFALNFLFHHYAYKRSKTDGLRFHTIVEIAGAVKLAYDEFARTVVVPKQQEAMCDRGKVGDPKAFENPYNLIVRDDEDVDDLEANAKDFHDDDD